MRLIKMMPGGLRYPLFPLQKRIKFGGVLHMNNLVWVTKHYRSLNFIMITFILLV
jgi:hypothetical protein